MSKEDIKAHADEFVKHIFIGRYRNHPDRITPEYVKEKHPHLTNSQAESLVEFSFSQTICLKGCYGNGEKIYPMWANSQ